MCIHGGTKAEFILHFNGVKVLLVKRKDTYKKITPSVLKSRGKEMSERASKASNGELKCWAAATKNERDRGSEFWVK